MESSNRFYRNHTLMLELFSDTRVSLNIKDGKSNVPCDEDMESQLDQVQSNVELMNTEHLKRIVEIERRSEKFANLMQLENDKLRNLTETPEIM